MSADKTLAEVFKACLTDANAELVRYLGRNVADPAPVTFIISPIDSKLGSEMRADPSSVAIDRLGARAVINVLAKAEALQWLEDRFPLIAKDLAEGRGSDESKRFPFVVCNGPEITLLYSF